MQKLRERHARLKARYLKLFAQLDFSTLNPLELPSLLCTIPPFLDCLYSHTSTIAELIKRLPNMVEMHENQCAIVQLNKIEMEVAHGETHLRLCEFEHWASGSGATIEQGRIFHRAIQALASIRHYHVPKLELLL